MPAARLALGSYDHVALELPGNPFGLLRDELVFEKADGPRTAALLANVSGTPLGYVEVAGKFGRELAAKGEARDGGVRARLARRAFGADVKKAVKRSHATHWNSTPCVLGAFSAAAAAASRRAGS